MARHFAAEVLPMVESTPLLSAINLHKTYQQNAVRVPVLRGLDLEVYAGEFLSVVGISGSGKSTLLHLLGTLDRPDQGSIHLNAVRIDTLSPERRAPLRNQTFGFTFHFYPLPPELNPRENVLGPQMIAHSALGWFRHKHPLRQRATELLERVGLSHRLCHRPRELSGGEMQRAAIARALINQPPILLADEPTGNLDAGAGSEIIRLLRDLNRQQPLTIIMVTHNLDLVTETDRMVQLVAGQVERVPAATCQV